MNRLISLVLVLSTLGTSLQGVPLFEVLDHEPQSSICSDEDVVYCKAVEFNYPALGLDAFQVFGMTFTKDHEITNTGSSNSHSFHYEVCSI